MNKFHRLNCGLLNSRLMFLLVFLQPFSCPKEAQRLASLPHLYLVFWQQDMQWLFWYLRKTPQVRLELS